MMPADIYSKDGADAAFVHDTPEARTELFSSQEATSTFVSVNDDGELVIGGVVIPVSGGVDPAELAEAVNDAIAGADIPAQVESGIESSSTVQAAVASAVTGQNIPGKVDAAVAGLSLATAETLGPDTPWKWAVVYGGNREVVIGERNDGTFYPATLNPGVADALLTALDTSQGWRFAIYNAGNGEVEFGRRNDGTFYPDIGVGALEPIHIFGDSMTAFWQPYLAGLAASTGRQVIAQGYPSQESFWVAAAQGGQPLRISAPGGIIPASGSVAVNVEFWQAPVTVDEYAPNGTLTGVLCGVPGTLSITTNPTGLPFAATFTRDTTGLETVVPPKSPFVTGLSARKHFPIFWSGRNNVLATGDAPGQIVADVRAMLAFTTRPDRALVLSIWPSTAETTGTSGRVKVDAANTALRNAFPTQFVDCSRLQSTAMLAAVGVTPTTEDTTNISNGIMPASFYADTLHPNAKGYEAMNLIVATEYTSRGWN